jgi:predicted transcriptional regulator
MRGVMLEKIMEYFKENTLTFGAPWKLTEESLSAAITLIMKAKSDREYVLIQEVKDKVELTDTGNINRSTATNKSGKTVFVRKGTLLKGNTQNRGVVIGTVLFPNQVKDLNIQCVHRTSGIVAGASFAAMPTIAPRGVEQAFLNYSGQMETWEAVAHDTRRLSAIAVKSIGTANDNLIGAVEELSGDVGGFREDIEKTLEKIPASLNNQVGMVVIDSKGVYGVELFDHPDSWRAFSDSVARNYVDVLSEKGKGLFTINLEQTIPAAVEFIEALVNSDQTVLDKEKTAKTSSLTGKGVVGEFTVLNKKVIHLIGSRKLEEITPKRTAVPVRPNRTGSWLRRRMRTENPLMMSVTEAAYVQDNSIQRDNIDTRLLFDRYFDGKGSYELLNNLKVRTKSWTELLNNSSVSRRTFATRLNEAEEMGLVERKVVPKNGKKKYSLTRAGRQALKEADAST